MKTIKENTQLTAKSICDSDCIFTLQVLEVKGNYAKIKYNKEIKRTKIRIDSEGNQYLRPDNYSMCPIFRAQ